MKCSPISGNGIPIGPGRQRLLIDRKAFKYSPYVAPSKPRDTPLTTIRDQVRAQLDDSFDDKLGGWGDTKILEHAEPIVHYAVCSMNRSVIGMI